jgi:hypothetical protein
MIFLVAMIADPRLMCRAIRLRMGADSHGFILVYDDDMAKFNCVANLAFFRCSAGSMAAAVT